MAEVGEKVAACRAAGRRVDYRTFVPDGEPTLDLHLGRELRALAPLGLRRAVLTNGSLLWQAGLRRELADADLVSLKVDAGDERTWRRLDRPAADLDFAVVRDGWLAFAAECRGELITETMLVAGVNDSRAALEATAARLAQLAPARAYLAVPTRPPAESWVRAPGASTLASAYGLVANHLPKVEWLTGRESSEFDATGDVRAALLAILAVHPMREGDARKLLVRGGAGPGALEDLIDAGRVVRLEFGREAFVARVGARSNDSSGFRPRGGDA